MPSVDSSRVYTREAHNENEAEYEHDRDLVKQARLRRRERAAEQKHSSPSQRTKEAQIRKLRARERKNGRNLSRKQARQVVTQEQ